MQIEISKKELSNELAVMKKVTNGRHNLPVCGNAAITILHQAVIFQATNLETAYVSTLGGYCNVNSHYDPANSITIPISNFMKAVKAVPKKQDAVSIAILYDPEGFPWGLKINDTISIVGMSFDNFPMLPKMPQTVTGYSVLSQGNLSKVSVINGAAGERRAHIRGLYLDFKNGQIVSTDGHRLNMAAMPETAPYDNVLMPKSAANLLLCPQLKNSIGNLMIGKQDVFVRTGNGYITSRILEGQFPDYLNLFRFAAYENILSVSDKTELVETIKEAGAILDQEYWQIGISLNAKCEITAVNPNIGEFSKLVKDFTYAGETFKAYFNPGFILDALNCLDEKGANLYFRDKEHPVIIQAPDENFQAIIMPSRD